MNLNGSLNNRLNIELNSKNLNDLLAAASTSGKPPAISLDGGQAQFKGEVTGGITSPQVSGHLALGRFSVQGRKFDSLSADVQAAKTRASVSERTPPAWTYAGAVRCLDWTEELVTET